MWNMRAQKMKLQRKAKEHHFMKPVSKIPTLYSQLLQKNFSFLQYTFLNQDPESWAHRGGRGEPKTDTDFISWVMHAGVKGELPQLPTSTPLGKLTGLPMSQSCYSLFLAWSSSNKNSLLCGMTSSYTVWLLLVSFQQLDETLLFQCGLWH